jgi:hypothetical protein
MDKELMEMIQQEKERNERYLRQGLERLAKEVPYLVIDPKKASIIDYTDVKYQVDNRMYYTIRYYGVSLFPTDLGYAIEYLGKHNTKYTIKENEYSLYLISDWDSCLGATVEKYSKTTGSKYKHVRRWRATHESSKGKYIELDGARHYLTNNQGAK